MIRKLFSAVFSAYTLILFDGILAGDSLNDVYHGRGVALNLALLFAFIVLGVCAIQRFGSERYGDGRIDGTINTWEIVHKLRKQGNEIVSAEVRRG